MIIYPERKKELTLEDRKRQPKESFSENKEYVNFEIFDACQKANLKVFFGLKVDSSALDLANSEYAIKNGLPTLQKYF